MVLRVLFDSPSLSRGVRSGQALARFSRGVLFRRAPGISYDAVRLNVTRAAPVRWGHYSPDFLRNCLLRNLGERVLFQMLRIAVKFADAFGELLGRHGVFVVHPAESVLGEVQLYIFACFSC
jgi:hypothetical protein